MTYSTNDRRRVVDRRYRKTYLMKQLNGIPTSLIPSKPAADHINRLVALGWSFKALEYMAGEHITDVTLNNLATGRHDTCERKTAAAALAIPYTLAPNALVDDTAFIPLLGARRRVQALLRLGWNHATMRRHAGVDTSHIVRGTYQSLTARKWRAIDNMYQQLCMTPGPSHITTNRARTAGFAPPLAWLAIDNPDAHPSGMGHLITGTNDIDPVTVDRILGGDWRLPSTPAEKTEVCRRWVAQGGSLRQLGKVTGWKTERYYTMGEAA